MPSYRGVSQAMKVLSAGVPTGAKIYVASAWIEQLGSSNGYGYAFDGTAYDDAGFVTTYGSDPVGGFDPAAVVFRVPWAGRYRLAFIANVSNGLTNLGASATIAGDSPFFADGSAFLVAGPASTTAHWPALWGYWEGRLDPATDVVVGLATYFNTGPTLDRLIEGSWMSIEYLG